MVVPVASAAAVVVAVNTFRDSHRLMNVASLASKVVLGKTERALEKKQRERGGVSNIRWSAVFSTFSRPCKVDENNS